MRCEPVKTTLSLTIMKAFETVRSFKAQREYGMPKMNPYVD